MGTRNGYIDLGKYVAAILVIAIHTRPFTDISTNFDFFFVDIICRMAVPFFAICTGFYFTSTFDKNSHQMHPFKKMFYKIIRMYLFWSIFYLFILLMDWHNNGILSIENLIGWCKSLIVSSSYYHLWYLSSLIYAMPLFVIIIKKLSKNYCLLIAIVLWALEAITYGYSFLMSNVITSKISLLSSFDALYTGLLRMLPLLLIGAYISRINMKSLTINKAILLSLISFLLLMVEAIALRHLGGTRFSFIFMTLVLSASVFVLVYKSGQRSTSNFHLLAKMSMTIYCLHPAVIWLLDNYFSSKILLFLSASLIATFISFMYYKYLKKLFVKKATDC